MQTLHVAVVVAAVAIFFLLPTSGVDVPFRFKISFFVLALYISVNVFNMLCCRFYLVYAIEFFP